MDRRFQFEVTARRCLNGYVWLDGVEVEGFDRPTSVLAPRSAAEPDSPPKDAKVEWYEPLKRESGLFRIMASLPIDRDAIRGFADTYGLIYDELYHFDYEHKGQGYRALGTPFSIWRQTILAVRQWVTVWDLVCANDARGLLNYVKRLPADLEPADATNPVLANLIANSWPILDSSPADRIAKAKHCLRFGLWESELRESVTLHLRYDAKRDTFGFSLVGEDLVVAIWAQLAMAVIDSKEFACCKVCGKPFEVSPEVARTNREYCSTPCRLKAYRARQREAARLRRRGKSLREIAKQLGSDMGTVRGWIEKAGEK
jgi:hypothetical protein